MSPREPVHPGKLDVSSRVEVARAVERADRTPAHV
jgi:hypothetical protein